MPIIYPNVSISDEDTPLGNSFMPPDMPAEEYFRTVIPGYRKDTVVYALLPTSQYIRGGLTDALGVISYEGWRDGRPTQATPGWEISATRWDYPGWSYCVSSPFGAAPEPTISINDAVIAHIGYFPPYAEYVSAYLPDILWHISPIALYFVQQPNWDTLIVDVYNRTVTETAWGIYAQTITDVVDDIVIFTPILTTLAALPLLSLAFPGTLPRRAGHPRRVKKHDQNLS